MLNVAVQPPAQARAGAVLYPPLVVSSDSEADYSFVQVHLLDAYGQVLDSQLHGTIATSRRGLDDRGSASSRPQEFAVFSDLALGYTGCFTLRVIAVRMDYGTYEAEAVGEVFTREIWIYDQDIAAERPCRSHARLPSEPH